MDDQVGRWVVCWAKREYLGSRTELKLSGLSILDSGPAYSDSMLLRDTSRRRRIEDGLGDHISELVKEAGRIPPSEHAEQANP